MRSYLAVLAVIAFFSSALPSFGQKYSVLGYHLGESEEQARTVARANGMTEFTCKDIAPTARRCDAKADGAAEADNTRTMTFAFLDSKACEIIYNFAGMNVWKVVRELDAQYGPHGGYIRHDEYFWQDGGVAEWQPDPDSWDPGGPNWRFDQLSAGIGEAKDTVYIKLKHVIAAGMFSNLASQDLRQSLRNSLMKSLHEGNDSKEKK